MIVYTLFNGLAAAIVHDGGGEKTGALSMSPDPKWLEILTHGDNVIAAFIGCGLLLLVNHWGWLTLTWSSEPLVWVEAGFVVFGSFAAVKILGAILAGLLR